ncbi:MAG TPA: hypothetical protein VER03_23075 [Bryobacteraceae bacterium]|nr:hypothetical protein [Bryobacteraceae bacterium]
MSDSKTAPPPDTGAFSPHNPYAVHKERKSAFGRWLFTGHRLDTMEEHGHTHPWYLVLWLTGVDYFSTLGYQPGIALLAAGALAPIATAFLIAVTLFCALPMYAQVARRSYVGLGSVAMLEVLLHGWSGKLLVLVLLGFAATGFIVTMTLSAADAALHAIENPFLHGYLGDHQMLVTIVLLFGLALLFLRGFNEAIGLATFVAVPYLLLNVVVLIRGFMEVISHPTVFPGWKTALTGHGDWTSVAIASGLIFPKLALGLSGFETGVSVMPLIRGRETDRPGTPPEGRIVNTQKLLAAAAIIMSIMLMSSSFVTTLLIPESAYVEGGPASGRAIAYLAHTYLGGIFGSVYDVSTILILWFAGASAMVGLLHLIPRYLPRFGMAPAWVAYPRPLVLVLFLITVAVTLFFRAEVEAQGGAYATGVLGLMLSGAIAAALALGREGKRAMSFYCWGVAAIFAYALLGNAIERPDGMIITAAFILLMLTVSGVSRYRRSTELRVSDISFCDPNSAELWKEVSGKKVSLVPIKTPTEQARRHKCKEINEYYKSQDKLAFVHVFLLDNRSEFLAPLQVEVCREDGNYVINVTGAIAIANTIAYLSELIDPIAIYLGLTQLNPMEQALRFLLFGEGETGMLVYTILLRYWEHTPEQDVQPYIFLMSEGSFSPLARRA